jgi:hypothetical protein
MIPARCGLLSKALLATYVLAAALLPLSHHDVVCHLKSSTHCTTCLVTTSGEMAPGAAGLDGAAMCDSGRATTAAAVYVHSTPVSASAGRSPPALG